METAVAKKEMSHSERFAIKVSAEFGSSVGMIALTQFQQRLVQNYFIALDSSLKAAEDKRNEKYNPLPFAWVNVNMEKLAQNVVAAARVGFDPAQSNHINLIPFRNKTTNKYDVGFIEGYRGIEMKAKKYGLEVPDHVEVQLVYSTDKFKSIKKDLKHLYEGYEFEIVNDFNRGDIIGGFYYHLFSQAPEKNKLVVMPLKEILKRRPEKAAPEFWGGEKDIWKDNKKTGEKEQVEGWYDKMCWKTVYRAAYSDITIDSQKIDEDYLRLKQMESDVDAAELEKEVSENANRKPIDIVSDPVEEQGGQPGAEDESVNEPEKEPVASGAAGPSF